MTTANKKTSHGTHSCRRFILCALVILLCSVFLSAAVCAAEYSFTVADGALTVGSTSDTAKTLTFILAATDADGRLTELHIESGKTVSDGSSAVLSFAAGEDEALTLNGGSGAVLLGTLYSFDENFSPVAEPVKVYASAKSSYIDAGPLFAF